MKKFAWLYIVIYLRRWIFAIIIGLLSLFLGLIVFFKVQYKFIVPYLKFFINKINLLLLNVLPNINLSYWGLFFAFFGGLIVYWGVKNIVYNFLSLYGVDDKDVKLSSKLYEQYRLTSGPNVVAIGGGTGLPVTLKALKNFTSNITAIVTVADDGGSSGRLRQDLKILPPGDFRNCLVALANAAPLLEKLFQYRFQQKGDLEGHSFGNLFIAALTKITGGFKQALKESSRILAINGMVVPSSTDQITLCAEFEDGEIIEGESKIPLKVHKIKKIFLKPDNVKASKIAIDSIKKSDIIIFGPGSLFTSIIPNLLLKDLDRVICTSNAIKVYICNVMTQPGETDGFTCFDHVEQIAKNSGFIPDYVIINKKPISKKVIEKYHQKNSYQLRMDIERIEKLGSKVILADVLQEDSTIRHDAEKLSKELEKIILKSEVF